MNDSVIVFGETLFDCFPDGVLVLGGAPFNVAWHLQALGDEPILISAIGNDSLGEKIIAAMDGWGMNRKFIQIDSVHQTGQVAVKLIDNEPHYSITPDCAYDFISEQGIKDLPVSGFLYHGTLGLRHTQSRACLTRISQQTGLSVFLDVNLRSPWWHQNEVFAWLKQARWAKMNEQELVQLGFVATDIKESMKKILDQFQLEQVIVTQGEKGAIVLDNNGDFFQQPAMIVSNIIDTVGAGDGFSALFIHGLTVGWSIEKTLTVAQQFAAKVIELRGAISLDALFYQQFMMELKI